MRPVSTIRRSVSVVTTSRSGMWMVTGTAFSSGLASIMTGLPGSPVQAADIVPRNSVWPGWLKPAS